ncbi:hypothetical protein K443DRAFT_117611, partial [Laccaria amethystina LaAM-08-1]
RKPQPKGGLERLKLYFRLLFERRNMVKMPSIATGSFSLFFQSLLACVLYVITFRTTAWYRLSAELAQRHVEAMLPELKETVLKMSHYEQLSVEFMQNQLYFLGGPQIDDCDEWDLDTPSLDERWKLFYNGKLYGWTHGVYFIWAMNGFLCVKCSPPLCHTQLQSLHSTRRAVASNFENPQALTPRPSVGVWWEVELMGMPSVLYFGYIYGLFFSEGLGQPLSENYKICIFMSLLLGVGILHASYITLTTKRDNEAIERSWRARINGWVFEQQYVTSAVSEGGWDRGFEMEVM